MSYRHRLFAEISIVNNPQSILRQSTNNQEGMQQGKYLQRYGNIRISVNDTGK